MLIDSGAEADLMSESDWGKIKHDSENGKTIIYDIDYSPSVRIRSYASSADLRAICSFNAWLETTAKEKPRAFVKFVVVQGGTRSLLSRETSVKMKLLNVGLEVNKISMEASEFPSIPNVSVDFDIDESVPPVRHPYVSIPAHYRQPAGERLAAMEASGIIEKVEGAPRWMSGLCAVPKGKNNFRLVVNMRGPNKAIRRQFHQMPRVDEIKVKLFGAKIFTKLDITSAFHHVPLSKKSRELTTFMTPHGMYRFKRLVFGVNCAPEIFQRIMENILTGIPNVIVYIDDILIFAKGKEELLELTERVLSALKDNNLTLNNEKCEYEKQNLTFLGHRLSAEGLDIDEQKVKDIKGFRKPKSTTELKSFLGLATYVRAFIPHFSDLAKPLQNVVKEKKFVWSEAHDESFEKLKSEIINCTTTQGFFSVQEKTILYTDASPYALGAVLVQENDEGDNRIISFASKTLTSTEARYAQTQREALAVVWATEHFYYYLLGQTFTIRTDAQGIAYIFDRNGDAPKRLIRRAEGWAMRLDAFDFNIEFVRGTLNIADPSSRLCTGDEEAYDETEAPCEIASITFVTPVEIVFDSEHLPKSEVAMRSTGDEELDQVRKALETGVWGGDIGAFRLVQEELHESDGILMRSGLAVLPVTLRPKALYLAHKGHPGMTKMKSILRERVWWPKMGAEVEDWVETCRTCALNGRKEPPTPMERSRLPSAPWDLVAVDFCGPYSMYGGISILAVVDYYSRFMLAGPVRSTDFGSTRLYLDEIFLQYGYPKEIKSDNGPPFNSSAYRQYCTERDIEPVFSWPLTPQQNGMAERAMQTVDKAMKSASVEGGDYRTALKDAVMAHNTAVHRTTNAVPSDVMHGRLLRRALPLTKPAGYQVDDEEIRERDWDAKQRSKEREDGKRRARESNITVGDTVVIRRAAKRKGETNYDPEELEVVGKRRGDLTMRSRDGGEVRRHVTLAKKIIERAGATLEQDSHVAASERSDNEIDGMPAAEITRTRPKRSATAPKYLGDYVRSIEANGNVNGSAAM